MLVVWTLSDLVLQSLSSFINNFEQAYYDIFFSLKSLFNFLVQSTRVTSAVQLWFLEVVVLKIPGKANTW